MIESPRRLAIVGLGPSSADYVREVETAGGRHVLFDQVWVVNTYAGVLAHDVVLHMDDLKLQEARAAAGNAKIGALLDLLRRHDKPVLTSVAYPDYPSAVTYPLQDVVNAMDSTYFNNTVAYGIALAPVLGVKELSLYGCDFNWAGASAVEPGRACCEYWIRAAQDRGVIVRVAPSSTLMDASGKAGPAFYGYDGVDVKVEIVEGRAVVTKTPRAAAHDAAEIERRYDHSR